MQETPMTIDLGIFDGSESGGDSPMARAFAALLDGGGATRAEAIVPIPIKNLLRRTCDFYVWIDVPEGSTKAILKINGEVKSFPVKGGRIYWNYPAGFAIYSYIDLWFEGSTETKTMARIAYVNREEARKLEAVFVSKRVMTEIRYEDVVVGRVVIYEGASSFVEKEEKLPGTVLLYSPSYYAGEILSGEVYPSVVNAFRKGFEKVEVDVRLDSKYLVGFAGYYEWFEAPLNASMIIRVDDNEVAIPVNGGRVDWRWFPDNARCSLVSLRFVSSTGEEIAVCARAVYVRTEITQKLLNESLKGVVSPVFYKGQIVAKIFFSRGYAKIEKSKS